MRISRIRLFGPRLRYVTVEGRMRGCGKERRQRGTGPGQGELSEWERSLSGVARAAGVLQYGLFQNAGYRGMYNLDYHQLRQLKGVESDRSPLDFMGKEELAANLFRGEARSLRNHDYVAQQRQRGAQTDRIAVDRADDRLFDVQHVFNDGRLQTAGSRRNDGDMDGEKSCRPANLGGVKKMEKQEPRIGMLEELKRKYPEKVEYLENVGFEWVKQVSDGQLWFGFVALRRSGQPIAFSYAYVEDTPLDLLKEQVKTGLPVDKE